jgi:3-hydroxybutyrate dehydrogenase
MLQGKTAIVTGSTSGIGLGIARALAAQHANILLNGFGDPVEIKKLQTSLGSEFGVKVAYSGADMSKPLEIADNGGAGDRRARPHRHSGQQCRHPVHRAAA